MDEDQLVAIGIAVVERHGLRAARNIEFDVVVAQEGDRHAFGVVQIGGREAVQIEEVRAQFAFEADPAGGRMRVIEVRALAVESLAAVLFFVGAFRNADVGLWGEFTLLEGVHGASFSRIAAQGGEDAIGPYRVHLSARSASTSSTNS